ncbi:MAG: PQQ-binding-like beta-propeller repeat protein [Deltaproteobacteria bacterium]
MLAGALLLFVPACSDSATGRPGKESATAAAPTKESPADQPADAPDAEAAKPVAGESNQPRAAENVKQTIAGGSKETERTGEDWPEFLGPRGTGISGETGLLERWPEEGPSVLWKKKIGEGYSAPSVRGNRLVLFHRPGMRQFPGPDEVVECLEADTGKPLWNYSYPTQYVDPYGYNGGPRCTPLLTADRCYTFGAEGMLTSLDLASGKPIWQRNTAEEFKIPPAFFGVGASPILEGNLLIVMVGGHPRSGVVAFDAGTGKTVWENVGPETFPDPPIRIQRDRPPAKLASYATPLAATIHGKRHILCFMRPGLVSVDPETGVPNFSFWFRSELHDSVNAARPVVVRDVVFLSAAYETGAALLKVHPDGKKYDVAWQDVDAMQNHWSTCIHHEGYLYGFSGRHEPGSTFRCIDLKTGKLQWQTHDVNANDEPDPKAGLGATEPKYYGRGSAILAEGKFIVMGERGTLALVEANPREFVETSRVKYPEAGYPSWTAPVLSRRRLYLSVARERRDEFGRYYGHDYHLLCLDLAKPGGTP